MGRPHEEWAICFPGAVTGAAALDQFYAVKTNPLSDTCEPPDTSPPPE